jgi:hypothetical protein
MARRHLLELGVDEAYRLLVGEVGAEPGLPPLEAIENEDWGRDYLLSRLAALDDATLDQLGLLRGGAGDETARD